MRVEDFGFHSTLTSGKNMAFNLTVLHVTTDMIMLLSCFFLALEFIENAMIWNVASVWNTHAKNLKGAIILIKYINIYK